MSSHVKTISTINPHSYVTSLDDADFSKALYESDFLAVDGIGFKIALNLLGHKVRRDTGYKIFMNMLFHLNNENGRVVFFGASQRTLALIKEKVSIEYPKIKVLMISPPFKPQLNKKESLDFIQRINDFQCDVLFIGMTAPKQEKWMHMYKDELKVLKIVSIGAVFDYYAEVIKLPPRIVRFIGLEWFYRLVQEPKRLFRRNFVSTPRFIQLLIKEKLRR
jgi:N-acetylglucosaminyldiphosphoundecaprenol N-acetyl-beta-D-mannosaminyltransferase